MGNKQAALKMWDSMAAGFAQSAIPDANSSFTMKLIEQNGMCPSGSRVLDVGCGAGKYAIALAKAGAMVVATDFSEQMLAQAKQCAARYGINSITFSQDDWAQADIAEKKWHKAFEFVLCSMTPAVFDEATLQKAIDACGGWLLITKPCRRTNSVIDKLTELLGLDPSGGKADYHIQLAFSRLWDLGALPHLSYDGQIWNSGKPLEEAILYYTNRLESSGILTEAQQTTLRDYLTNIAVDGIVNEETHTTVTAIYCNLNQIQEELL